MGDSNQGDMGSGDPGDTGSGDPEDMGTQGTWGMGPGNRDRAVTHLAPDHRVECPRGLIQHQHSGGPEQGPGQRHPLCLPP